MADQVGMEPSHIVALEFRIQNTVTRPLRSIATFASASSIGTVASAMRTMPSFSPMPHSKLDQTDGDVFGYMMFIITRSFKLQIESAVLGSLRQ